MELTSYLLQVPDKINKTNKCPSEEIASLFPTSAVSINQFKMMRHLLLLLSVLFYSGVEAKRSFGNCPGITTKILDNRLARGNWYLYAVNPSRWTERCNKYSITSDTNNNYYVTETYVKDYKIYDSKKTNEYTLDYNVNSPKFTLRKTFLKYIKEEDTWTLVTADSTFSEYMVLYKCGLTLPWVKKEEVQIWVKQRSPKASTVQSIKQAIQLIKGFEEDDFQYDKLSDC